MQVKVKEIKEMKVIGVRGKCNMATTMEDIPPLWDKVMANQDKIQNKTNPNVAYGVSTMIDDKSFFCNACYEVSDTTNIPDGMEAETIPAMKIAIFEHKGKMDNLKDTYGQIMNKLIPEADLELDFSKPCIEMYDERFKYNSDDSICEIWMPIK